MPFTGDATERYAPKLQPHLEDRERVRTLAEVFFKGDRSGAAQGVGGAAGAAGGLIGGLVSGLVRSRMEKRQQASAVGGEAGSLAHDFPQATQLRPL